MQEQHVGTLTYAGWKADIFSTNLPGEFKITYQDPDGNQKEETPLTGVSSYKQRENEILEHLRALSSGLEEHPRHDLNDAGEY
jgi:hypothetical protein